MRKVAHTKTFTVRTQPRQGRSRLTRRFTNIVMFAKRIICVICVILIVSAGPRTFSVCCRSFDVRPAARGWH
mgnify:CR=1 FL=1